VQVWKIAVRNIFRQKRRTVLTVLTMFGGFVLASISISWSDGTYTDIIDMFTRNQLGHIQIHHEGYLDKPSLYKTIDNYMEIGEKLESIEGVESWTPRLYSAGLTSVDEKSAGARIMGIDPIRENQTTRFEKKISEGRILSPEPQHEAVLGKGLTKLLKAGIGDTIVVVSQGADGSIANDLYNIVGIVDSGDEISDRSAFYLHIKDAQELLVLGDRIHEIVVISERLKRVPRLTATITGALDDETLDVDPWQDFARAFYRAMRADQKGNWISIFVIILIVAIGVLNTILMAVMERLREYGLLRAVGTRPGKIVSLVLAETAIMAAISIVIGTLVALAINYWLSFDGVSMPTPMTWGGMEFRTMRTEINARCFYIPAITVFLTALFVSIFPAIRAAHVAPARVMRMH
jgi:ABC-type lipoprotein release transport system permease subunit